MLFKIGTIQQKSPPFILMAAADPAPPQKSNIIFILADDLGIGSVSSYGAENGEGSLPICFHADAPTISCATVGTVKVPSFGHSKIMR